MQKVAFALTVRSKAALEQSQPGRARSVLAALFASRHLVRFGSPLTDMATRREARQFKRLAARGRDFRHFFASHRGRGQDQPG
jgi:hypothetical protein